MGCKTVSGPSPNASCVFPFKFSEITYHKCTTAYFGTDKPAWCSTLVDASGKHVKGNYGSCEQDCNLKIGKKDFIKSIIGLSIFE